LTGVFSGGWRQLTWYASAHTHTHTHTHKQTASDWLYYWLSQMS